MAETCRQEQDSLGTMTLTEKTAYGVHTARALQNFDLSDVRLRAFPELVKALAMVKLAAARSNAELQVLPNGTADTIIEVCEEIIAGKHHEHFLIDMIQGGAGTSTNMNANEVIANIGLQKRGLPFGTYSEIHPNDAVNCSQSTNDVYPTAIRLAAVAMCSDLSRALSSLSGTFAGKAEEFADVEKVGRTQLQDAVPMTLGMEFAAFAATVAEDIERIAQLSLLLHEVNLGGTAVGTGVNAPPGYQARVIEHLSDVSGLQLTSAKNLLEASYDLGAFITFSGVLKRIAVKLSKICNDLRLLSSGPIAGIGEIRLPPMQAGSSIMPGKVNPVIPEAVNQVAYQVVGNDVTITMAAEAGQLQLNAMEPIIVFNLLSSIRLLCRAVTMLDEKCVKGIEADRDRCAELLDKSLVNAAALVPIIGYERAARIAKTALAEGKTLKETALELRELSVAEFDNIQNGTLY